MRLQRRVEQIVGAHPAVTDVELVGSRARRTANALSDWDFQLHTSDDTRVMRELPALARGLEPLGALWDPLGERATYCLILRGAVKVDLFPGEKSWSCVPPLEASAENLESIDMHFWDWTLWLGSKELGGRDDLVRAELGRMKPRPPSRRASTCGLMPWGAGSVDASTNGAQIRWCSACA